MPTVIDWSSTVEPSELVRQGRDALTEGLAVVLPGDCGYLALWKSGTRVELPAPALFPWELGDLGLEIPSLARRLMFRAWPAPLIVEFPASGEVPAAVNGFGRFRYPDHPLCEAILPAIADRGPILVADTGDSTADAALERLGSSVGLVVDVGELPVAKPSVVRVEGSGYRILEVGAFAREEIERLAARIILFVCTGNTCRSPLAEGLTKKMLADRLGCSVSELPARGFWVLSAGVSAFGGGPASGESYAVAEEFGADLSGHVSRPVNPQLLAAADDVIAMTAGHLHTLQTRFPGLGSARLLCGESDLDDPIGAGQEVYRECARTIVQHLERFLLEWVGS
ncbi:MAG: hypothetical protein L0241_10535 [Planctomycetia bacterium]|nr:hypothetical protein [Planctomycetia bacterium]